MLVVKTHSPRNVKGYGTGIVIVRNPFHALIAEQNRLRSSSMHQHTAVAREKYFSMSFGL